jgi:hypothetical protein
MKVQDAREQIKLRGWAMQIDACNKSGLPVRRWCEDNGVAVKSYYYHVKRVREELLNTLEVAETIKQAEIGAQGSDYAMGTELVVSNRVSPQRSKELPVFAALPVPQPKGAAVTVRVGAYAVDIQNGAEESVIEQVLKAVSRL